MVRCWRWIFPQFDGSAPIKFGLGLPIAINADLLTRARRADTTAFNTLALADRLVYDGPDPLVTLAGVAAVTKRIRVRTEVLIAPDYNTAILAKQTATLDRLSGGRFTLGLGVGMSERPDDAPAAGIDMRRRGRRLNEQMELLRRTWAGKPYAEGIGPVGPLPVNPGGPEVLFGGFAPALFDRIARWGDGFLGAGLPPAGMEPLFRSAEKAWAEYGRSGRPRPVAQVNAVLGDASVIADAHADFRRYYTFMGERLDDMTAAVLTTEKGIREAVAEFTDIGAEEVVSYCGATDSGQIDRFADVLFGWVLVLRLPVLPAANPFSRGLVPGDASTNLVHYDQVGVRETRPPARATRQLMGPDTPRDRRIGARDTTVSANSTPGRVPLFPVAAHHPVPADNRHAERTKSECWATSRGWSNLSWSPRSPDRGACRFTALGTVRTLK